MSSEVESGLLVFSRSLRDGTPNGLHVKALLEHVSEGHNLSLPGYKLLRQCDASYFVCLSNLITALREIIRPLL